MKTNIKTGANLIEEWKTVAQISPPFLYFSFIISPTLRVQNEQFSEEKGFILCNTEKEV